MASVTSAAVGGASAGGQVAQTDAPSTAGAVASRAADNALGSKTGSQDVRLGDNAAQPPGPGTSLVSNHIHDMMAQSGMTNVSQPPTDDQLREYYKKHSPQKDNISK